MDIGDTKERPKRHSLCVNVSLTNLAALLALSDIGAHKAPPNPLPPSHHQPPFLFGAVSQSPCERKKKSLCVVFGSGQFSATICLLLIALSVYPIALSLFFSLSFSTSLPKPANLSFFFLFAFVCLIFSKNPGKPLRSHRHSLPSLASCDSSRSLPFHSEASRSMLAFN